MARGGIFCDTWWALLITDGIVGAIIVIDDFIDCVAEVMTCLMTIVIGDCWRDNLVLIVEGE